jgi:general L-amino acid transport system substrate-binding protein
MMNSDNPTVQRLLGVSDAMGDLLGLPADWGYQMISQVGNYGEIFDRNVGPDTPLRLERGQNDLWTRGGLMYAMPVR